MVANGSGRLWRKRIFCIRWCYKAPNGPIAQLDRVADFYSAGCRFESCWDRQRIFRQLKCLNNQALIDPLFSTASAGGSLSFTSPTAPDAAHLGFVDKLVIRPDGQIIGGHAWLDALNVLAVENAECRVVAGLNETQYQALALALNRIPENSSWDEDLLRELLGELQEAGENPLALGFKPADLDKLLKEPDELTVKEIETGPVNDEFWISVRGPLADQAAALKALQDALKPFAGITVELGTISPLTIITY